MPTTVAQAPDSVGPVRVTLPEARRHGHGAAITDAVVDVAPELPSVLIASGDGHAIYRRLGYLDLFRTTTWEHPPTA